VDDFVRLFWRHGPAVHSYLSRRAGHQQADDLLEEVWVRAFRSRDRYDDRLPAPGDVPPAWVLAVSSAAVRRLSGIPSHDDAAAAQRHSRAKISATGKRAPPVMVRPLDGRLDGKRGRGHQGFSNPDGIRTADRLSLMPKWGRRAEGGRLWTDA
jgi:Sigma-70 region 2